MFLDVMQLPHQHPFTHQHLVRPRPPPVFNSPQQLRLLNRNNFEGKD